MMLEIDIEPLGLTFSLLYFIICMVFRAAMLSSTYLVSPRKVMFKLEWLKGYGYWKILAGFSVLVSFMAAFSLMLTVALTVVTVFHTSKILQGYAATEGLGHKRLKELSDEAVMALTGSEILYFVFAVGSCYILFGLFMLNFAQTEVTIGFSLGFFLYGYYYMFVMATNLYLMRRDMPAGQTVSGK